jgi:hypothetical protein
MANIASIIVASFDGVDTLTGQTHQNSVHTRVNRIVSRSAERWHGSALPPVTLTLRIDGRDVASIDLAGLQLHPLVRGKFVAAARAALEASAAEGWAIVDTAPEPLEAEVVAIEDLLPAE